MTYATLGEIAEELKRMRADGMTRSSVEYALEQVYWDQAEPEAPRLVTTAQVERGTAAAIATLEDRETGAGSDLERDIYRESDGVYVEIMGRVDLPQLVREILEATR